MAKSLISLGSVYIEYIIIQNSKYLEQTEEVKDRVAVLLDFFFGQGLESTQNSIDVHVVERLLLVLARVSELVDLLEQGVFY